METKTQFTNLLEYLALVSAKKAKEFESDKKEDDRRSDHWPISGQCLISGKQNLR
jgi:hypothetical protein